MANKLASHRLGELNTGDRVSKASDIQAYVDGIDSIQLATLDVSPAKLEPDNPTLSNEVCGPFRCGVVAGRANRIGTNHLLILSVGLDYIVVSGDYSSQFQSINTTLTSLSSLDYRDTAKDEYTKKISNGQTVLYYGYTDTNYNYFCRVPIKSVVAVNGLNVLTAESAEAQPLVGTKIEFASKHEMDANLRAGDTKYRCQEYFSGTTLSSYKISSDYSSTFHVLGHPDIGQDDFQLPVGSSTPDSAAGKSYQTVLGLLNTAQERASTAIGSMNTAQGRFSVALGNKNIAAGFNSTAIGGQNVALGPDSLALGMRSYATDNNSIVLNATGNKQVSNGPNTVSIYGKKVLINGKETETLMNVDQPQTITAVKSFVEGIQIGDNNKQVGHNMLGVGNDLTCGVENFFYKGIDVDTTTRCAKIYLTAKQPKFPYPFIRYDGNTTEFKINKNTAEISSTSSLTSVVSGCDKMWNLTVNSPQGKDALYSQLSIDFKGNSYISDPEAAADKIRKYFTDAFIPATSEVSQYLRGKNYKLANQLVTMVNNVKVEYVDTGKVLSVIDDAVVSVQLNEAAYNHLVNCGIAFNDFDFDDAMIAFPNADISAPANTSTYSSLNVGMNNKVMRRACLVAGKNNEAIADFSVALGRKAHAIHYNTFVWGPTSNVSSVASYTFNIGINLPLQQADNPGNVAGIYVVGNDGKHEKIHKHVNNLIANDYSLSALSRPRVKSIAFDGINSLKSITVGKQSLDDMMYAALSARISQMIDSKIANEINNI